MEENHGLIEHIWFYFSLGIIPVLLYFCFRMIYAIEIYMLAVKLTHNFIRVRLDLLKCKAIQAGTPDVMSPLFPDKIGDIHDYSSTHYFRVHKFINHMYKEMTPSLWKIIISKQKPVLVNYMSPRNLNTLTLYGTFIKNVKLLSKSQGISGYQKET